MLWTGTSTVQLSLYQNTPADIVSTIITNMNSTSAANVLTMGVTWNHVGSGTLFGANQFSLIQQVQ